MKKIRPPKSKRDLFELMLYGHDAREYPAGRDAQIVIITRSFRILENIWNSCGAEEVWRCIRSRERKGMPLLDQKRRRTDR